MINSTADRVMDLCDRLGKRGFSESAIAVATTFSGMNELVDRRLPLTTAHMGAVLYGNERRFRERENHLRELYDVLIKPYELLVS